MTRPPISRGFRGRRPDGHTDRLPPGQYVTSGFPVLSAGPTPHTDLESWSFSIYDRDIALVEWSWFEFEALPQTSRPALMARCCCRARAPGADT